ncbi:MAG: putative RND superfamily exporter protein [Arenicella sp.]|jgi:predicted RND superfamily exporter protein
MWFKLSQFILRNRLLILGLIVGITVYFGYFGLTNIKVDNTYGTMLPKDSPAKKDYELLKKSFGGSESLLIFSIQCEKLYELENFQAWYDIGEKISDFDAIDSVISEAHLYQVIKDTENKKFAFDKVAKRRPETQAEVDSLQQIVRGNPFYDGLLFNKEENVSLMMAFVNEEIMADIKKANILFDVEDVAYQYEDQLGKVRVSGMPHIRVMVGAKLKGELGLFIGLSIGMTSLLLFIFFRSLKIVLICNVVVFVGVIWSLGSIGAFNFQLSILMVLIPPLIIVISIPNCIFLINKFHQEIIEHGNKAKALSRVIRKIGNATFLTNLTTALGFSTFIFTNSERLAEFGIIASLNILVVFFLSITILPIILSYSAIPKSKHLKHLEKQWLHLAVQKLEYLSLYKRKWVYIVTAVLITVAGIGISKIEATGNITGDLPADDPITTDLKFIEENFGGSIPFDIILDTKKPNTFHTRFEEIEEIQDYVATYGVFSKSLSATDGIKLLSMAYSNNNPEKFEIPSIQKMARISDYVANSLDQTSGFSGISDSASNLSRISMQIVDTGSYQIKEIVERMKPALEEIINPDKPYLDAEYLAISKLSGAEKSKSLQAVYDKVPIIQFDMERMFAANNSTELASYESTPAFNDTLRKAMDEHEWGVIITGTSVVASNGTQYLVSNLFISLGCAIVLIGILMALLFRSWRMVVASLIPNFIPLLFTAGIMGFVGIPIKPSTLLVFSIAFGISVDDTIHFLAKFRQEMKLHEHDLRRCILVALRETGISMIYTSIVLFFGFLMFTGSQFGGTKALGLLVSLTLLIAMFANLMILPSLLLGMERKISGKALAEPLLQLYDEEEDIELEHLEIEQTLEKYREEDSKKNPGEE